jgi:hypothetical protein
VRIDLQRAIDNLRSFKSDLEAYFWERPGDGETARHERYQIGFWMRLVGERTAVLEDVLMHMGTPTVIAPVASPDEAAALRQAVVLVDRWIPEGEPFDDVRRCVADVLDAADILCLPAASGRPDRDE